MEINFNLNDRKDDQDHSLMDQFLKLDISLLSGPDIKGYEREAEVIQITSNRMKSALGQDFQLNPDYVNASLFPLTHSQNIDLVCFVVIFNHWQLTIDPILEKDASAIEPWLESIRQAHAPEEGKLATIFNCMISFGKEKLPESFLKKFLDIALQWTGNHANLHSLMNRLEAERPVSVEEYLECRKIDIGMVFYNCLYEFDAKLEVNKQLEANEDWIKLNNYSNECHALINDLFSLRKDAKSGQYKYNVVYVKMMAHNLSAQTAVDQTLEEIKEIEHKMQKIQENLRSLKNKSLDNYLSQLLHCINVGKYWHKIADLYQD